MDSHKSRNRKYIMSYGRRLFSVLTPVDEAPERHQLVGTVVRTFSVLEGRVHI